MHRRLHAAGDPTAQSPSAIRRPRVVVLSDFPPLDVIPVGQGEGAADTRSDPDDVQSMVRFLVYANEFDVAGLVATAATVAYVARKQNILHMQTTRKRAELERFLGKLRVYMIGLGDRPGQDGSGQWPLDRFPNLFIIVCQRNYRGMFWDAPGSDPRSRISRGSRQEITLPIELKRELFDMLSRDVARQLKRRKVSEEDVLEDFEASRRGAVQLVADANVLLSAVIGGRAPGVRHDEVEQVCSRLEFLIKPQHPALAPNLVGGNVALLPPIVVRAAGESCNTASVAGPRSALMERQPPPASSRVGLDNGNFYVTI